MPEEGKANLKHMQGAHASNPFSQGEYANVYIPLKVESGARYGDLYL
jgi:hypothetical protein